MITCLDIDKPFIRRDNSHGHGTVRINRHAASMAMVGRGLFLTIECRTEKDSAPTPMSLTKANDDRTRGADIVVSTRLNNHPLQHRPVLACSPPGRIINDTGAFAFTRSGSENAPGVGIEFADPMQTQALRNATGPYLETAG
ncbi:hypothetical protein [Labrenzia sp. DG1229]|uniref:hypothetical protein n=1 Tax=Labrenzia sp. DG1229 TaxID=681847 RepID=UPI00048D0131|nr:hypothetical protein [Labrenzia sp. DG1229]